jgi:rhamnose transport system permease protein
VLNAYPADFAYFGQGYVLPLISFELVLFVSMTALCAIILARSAIGRRIYALGANPVAALFSGVAVTKYRFNLFLAVGAVSGLAAILLTSRLGSTRPSIALGWELDIISIVILGGVAVSGGRGSITGVVLAALLFGFANYGLGLLNVPGIIASLLMGVLLILVVAIPNCFPAASARLKR